MLRVLVVDDHTIFRSGVRRLLLDETDVRVTGEARNGAEALEQVKAQGFDVVLLDINMEGRSGLDVLASLRAMCSCPTVLILSMYPEEQYALVAVQAGAAGYVAKDAEPSELIRAIRTVAAGGHYLSAQAAPFVRDRLRGTDDRPAHQRLTVREHQIMLMLVKGMSVTHIAEEMMISVKTVSTHRTYLLENRRGRPGRARAVRRAARAGALRPRAASARLESQRSPADASTRRRETTRAARPSPNNARDCGSGTSAAEKRKEVNSPETA